MNVCVSGCLCIWIYISICVPSTCEAYSCITVMFCRYIHHGYKKKALSFAFTSVLHSVVWMCWVHLSSTILMGIWSIPNLVLLQTELQWGLYACVFVVMMYLLPALSLKLGLGLSGRVLTSDARGRNTRSPTTVTQARHKQSQSKTKV